MLRMNRGTTLAGAGLLVMALSACQKDPSAENDPARTVERPAGTDAVPAQVAEPAMHAGETGVTAVDPAVPDVEIRRSADGHRVEVRRGGDAEAGATEPSQSVQPTKPAQ